MPRKQTKTAAEFEHRLTYISRVFTLVAPLTIFVICGSIETVFTHDFTLRQRLVVPVVLGVAILLVLGRLIPRTLNARRLAIEYSIMTILTIFLYRYLVTFPSPYSILTTIIGVLIYFDFGAIWAGVSLILQYWAIILMLHVQHTSISGILDVVAYGLVSLSLGYLIIRLQQLSRQEVDDIEKNYDKALASDQQVQSLINNITDGVIAVNQHGKIAIYNAAALDVLDVNTAIINKKLATVFKPIDTESQPVDIAAMLANTSTPTVNRDLRLQYQDGSTANLFIGIAPIYLGYGKSGNNGYTLILRDITREKSLEEERDEFISVVSHELRTPIAITEGSISNAQFIVDKTGDLDTIRKTLKESHNQVIFLADMINDLSTLSRAERGKLELDIAPINVADLVKELVANYTPQAEAKNLELHTKLAGSMRELESSKLYVREILQNFITNAIKYTEKGSVTIKATADSKGVTFAISDTGIGISKSDQDKVFDKFFRSEDYRTRQNNGTGLGLYVTMKLVRLIHAEIDVKSELNKGSTFSIFIPNLK